MSKHTPGPWIKDRNGHLVGSNGRHVNVVRLGVGQLLGAPDDDREEVANATLMQSAPDLMEVAMAILEYNSMDEDDHTALMVSYQDVLEKAKSAIAKAEGRS